MTVFPTLMSLIFIEKFQQEGFIYEPRREDLVFIG